MAGALHQSDPERERERRPSEMVTERKVRGKKREREGRKGGWDEQQGRDLESTSKKILPDHGRTFPYLYSA